MAVISMPRQSQSPRKVLMSREVDPQAVERARARALRTLAHEVHQRIQAQSMRPQTAPHLYKPRMDLYDDEQSPTIYAMVELPGVNRDNISVKVQGGLLVVDGRRASPLLDRIDFRGGNPDTTLPAFKIKELKYGAFHREIPLPQNSTTEDIVAEMTDGMLLLSWPRIPCSSTGRAITTTPSLSTTTATPDIKSRTQNRSQM